MRLQTLRPKKVLVLVLLGLLAIANPPSFADSAHNFSAAIQAHDLVAPDPTRCAELSSTILGNGIATGLGKVTIEMHDCFSPSGPPFVFQNGQFTMTGQDGQLFGTYAGQLVLLPISSQTGTFGIEATYTITGGSGRYQGATGAGTATGTDNIFTGQVYLVLKGTLRF